MAQNIYDNLDFFHGYSQFGRSVEGLAGAAEWPALQALLPDLNGRRVVDLGCGYGWFCRWARTAGATWVLGLDISEKMLTRAASTTSDDAVTYARADLEHLDLPEAAFDLVYSSLAFHYVQNLSGLLAQIHQALAPGDAWSFSSNPPSTWRRASRFGIRTTPVTNSGPWTVTLWKGRERQTGCHPASSSSTKRWGQP